MKDVNKDHLRKATEALRSGKYRQIRGFARTDEGFCAYGVMADVSGVGEWKRPVGDCYCYYLYLTPRPHIAAALDEWYGTRDGFVWVHDEEGRLVTLMELNDDLGYDFHQIAALIEKEHEL